MCGVWTSGNRGFLFLTGLLLSATRAIAQQPFYTDDSAVTERGKWHFEFFNEFDFLQPQLHPSLKQNTANYKLNYGLPYNLEIDVDNPYLTIFRTAFSNPQHPHGIGDTNVGLKWSFHQETSASKAPALSATFYVELPTGDATNQLGSGLYDYWLNGIAQKHITEHTRVTTNAGILFAGNTSTGLVGIESTRGRVYTGGLSVLRDYTKRLTLGVEAFGGYAENPGLARSQLQFLAGGSYELRKGFSFDFAVLGGKFLASPRVGVQLGFAVDFPAGSAGSKQP
jgi:hypothetical protein